MYSPLHQPNKENNPKEGLYAIVEFDSHKAELKPAMDNDSVQYAMLDCHHQVPSLEPAFKGAMP